jgi:hypothetical protein
MGASKKLRISAMMRVRLAREHSRALSSVARGTG